MHEAQAARRDVFSSDDECATGPAEPEQASHRAGLAWVQAPTIAVTIQIKRLAPLHALEYRQPLLIRHPQPGGIHPFL